ncbi:MAG TPA: methylenetetrahydrofolate reductase [Polyangia bacterium]|nr:methylenetetrahydrofolate reductase [Polyangia bacterium]
MRAGSRLEQILESGQFAVTAEAGPPKGSSPDGMRKKGELLKSSCDAINVTDNQAAVVRMSSLAGCILLKETGAEPVLQMVVRDRNRLALQSDILGAAALGIRNVLCLAGDHQRLGNHPTAAGAYDIDPIQLIQMIKTLRDDHRVESGETISGEVPLYIGSVAHPFADPLELHMITLAKKIRAGANFIQTQAIYELPRFIAWMDKVREQGLHEKAHILASVLPIKSAEMARRMRSGVPGMRLPDELVQRIERAADAKAEGIRICVEMIEQLKRVPGVHGVHIMAVASEDSVPGIVKQAGLSPRPERPQ